MWNDVKWFSVLGVVLCGVTLGAALAGCTSAVVLGLGLSAVAVAVLALQDA